MIFPLRLLVWVLPVLLFAVPAVAFALYLAAVLGSPGSCVGEDRPITFTLQAASSFQEKWDQLNASLDAGQPATATFSEDEATSRARLWVSEHDVPVDELFICFSDEGGAASAEVDIPIVQGDVDILVRGTVLLLGVVPQAEVQEIEVGGIPSPLTDLVEDFVTDLIDDQSEDALLAHDYTLTFSEGQMTVAGEP